jgi:hypothetical protein
MMWTLALIGISLAAAEQPAELAEESDQEAREAPAYELPTLKEQTQGLRSMVLASSLTLAGSATVAGGGQRGALRLGQ